MAIHKSKDSNVLWSNICKALQDLGIDYAELVLFSSPDSQAHPAISPKAESLSQATPVPTSQPPSDASVQPSFQETWLNNGFNPFTAQTMDNLFKIELPIKANGQYFGYLWLMKDLERDPLNGFTLTRIEHLRRAVTRNLIGRKGSSSSSPDKDIDFSQRV
jgi:hypothetical protein